VAAIAEIYRKTRKVPDLFWNTWICRPPAAVLVWLLGPTRITPNQVTLGAFGVALASAALIVLLPGYFGLLAAVVLFELSYVLDCTDGMLARLRGVQSTPGHLLDFLMDEIKAFLILAAVAVRLWLEQGSVLFLLLGIGGLVVLATGIAITTFQRRPEIAPPPSSDPQPPAPPRSLLRRAIGLVERLAKFLIHYPSYILVAAIAGRIELYFYPYIAVNALYALRALAWVTLRFGRG
jgi:phosphatidylglycerophosphate synthase